MLGIDSFAADDSGVSEVVAMVLVTALVVMGVASIVLVAGPQLTGSQDAAEIGQAEQALTQFDAEAERVATGSTSSQTIDLGLRGNSGTLDVQPEEGNITVEYIDNLHSSDSTEIVNQSLGTVIYENGDSTVGYQGGGVWRSDGTGSVMISSPLINFEGNTLTMPIVTSDREGSVHSDLRISSKAPSEQKFPDAPDGHLSNKVDSGTLWITIESRYDRAWGQFFEDETNAEVLYPEEGTVTIIFFGTQMQFSPDAGIIATSGPGEIRIEGSGSYIDSYNSSIGPYSESDFDEGAVKSAGDVLQYGGSQIYGNVESNKHVNLSGGSKVTGDVSALEGWETDGDSEIEGDTDYDADVPILPPINTYVETKAEELARENNNNDTELITDDRVLDLEDGNELSPGDYYLEEIDFQSDETLVLNATEGDITIVVENYVRLDEGTIEVLGEEDDGTVQLFVASEESSGQTVPGTGGEPADHFYVQGDSQITVKNDSSPRFQVLAPSHFTGAVRASGSDDVQVTATMFAPTPSEGDGQFIVRDGELFGMVVTGELTAENNAEIHFDHAVMDEEIPFGEGMSLLDYLYITEHGIAVGSA